MFGARFVADVSCAVSRWSDNDAEGLKISVLLVWFAGTFICRLSGDLGASASWNCEGLYTNCFTSCFLQTIMKINRCKRRKVNTVCVTCVFSFSADNIPSEIDKNFLWKYRLLGCRNQHIGRKSFFHASLRNVNEATKLHGVTPETTANFSHLPQDLRQCAYDQGEPVTTDLSFGTQLTLVMCRSFLNISDIRGKDCTLQVKFLCLRNVASNEISRGVNFLWTHEDHSSQDAAQAYNLKIRRFSSCRVADVPWTSPV